MARVYLSLQSWQVCVFRKAFGLLLYPLVFLSRLQDTYPKARGSASIYFSSRGWSAHVFKKNLRPGNVSTALLHLAFLFSLLIVIFLKALNVVGLVPICRCKGGMSFRGAFGLVHFSFTLSSSEGCTCDRTRTCLSLQGWQAHVFQEGLRPGTVATSLLHTVFFTRL